MTITVDPVLVAFGSLAVRWSGVLAAVGLGLAVWLSMRAAASTPATADGAATVTDADPPMAQRSGLGRRVLLDALAWSLPAGVLCARAMGVLAWWDYYLTHAGEVWQLQLDGLSLWGGLLGGGLVAAARLRSRADPTRRRRAFDLVAPYAALGIAVAGLGALIDGQGQGVPADLPWATMYASPLSAAPDFGVPRHPVQLYEALMALSLGLLLSRLPRALPAGSRAALFLIIWGLARVGLGPLRLEPAFLFGLQLEQLLALVAVALGVLVGTKALLPRWQPARAGPARASTAPGGRAAEERERVPA